MSAILEVTGYWWLPSNPEDIVPGILRYYGIENTVLELNGCFESHSVRVAGNPAGLECDVICGSDYQSNRYSLLKSILASHSKSSYEISTFQVEVVIKGLFLDNSDDKVFNKIRLHFPNIERWQLTDLISFKSKYGKDIYECDLNPCDNTLKVDLGDGYSFSILPQLLIRENMSDAGRVCSITRATYITIQNSSDRSISEFLEMMSIAEQLVSFIFMAPQYANEISVKFSGDNGLKQVLIRTGKSVNAALGPLLKYSIIEENLPTIVERWYEYYDDLHMIIGNHIRTMDYSKSIGDEDILLISQSVEGLAKSKFCIPPREPLDKLLDNVYDQMAGIPMIVANRADSDVARITRNYYAHFSKGNDYDKVARGLDLLRLEQQLKLLLACLLMSCFGLDDNQINECLEHSFFNRWTFLNKLCLSNVH